jgi:hypothetical protein
MTRIIYVAIILSIILLFPNITSLEIGPKKVTTIVLSQVQKSAYFGEELKVTGRLLIASTGEGIANADIKIIDNEPVGQKILVSTKTRKYGYFIASWKTEFGERDRTMHLIVKYDGSADYTASVSREQTVMVRLLPLEINFLYLHSYYKEGDAPEIIFMISSLRNPVEPDVLRVSFNGKPVKVDSYGSGNYVYQTEPLSKGHNQFFVSVSKDGYRTASKVITIHVI